MHTAWGRREVLTFATILPLFFGGLYVAAYSFALGIAMVAVAGLLNIRAVTDPAFGRSLYQKSVPWYKRRERGCL